MDDVESGGTAGAETADIGAAAAPGQERQITASVRSCWLSPWRANSR